MTVDAEGQQARTSGGLTVRGLRVETTRGASIVDGLDLDIATGRVLGLVGESGSGKTTVGLALLGMARRGMAITAGEIKLDGTNLLALSTGELRTWRGSRVSYVPQDPSAALNPAMRVGRQVLEALATHGALESARQRQVRVDEVLGEVGLPTDHAFQQRWPHELSGGQQQRIGIAMAFACRPALVVLDEPTTGLDVTTQAYVLDTVRELAERHGCAALYISHDLAVVADVSDEIAVLYAGNLVEKASTDELARAPRHPYTARLVAAVPDLGGRRELRGIPGTAPSPGNKPGGCRFEPRCTLATPECVLRLPDLVEVGDDHWARCIHQDRVRPAVRVRDVAERSTDESESLLRISDLTARYGDTAVLHDLDLTVATGSCTALLGESGSGKTTLARTVAGLHSNADGTVLFRGEPLPFGAVHREPGMRRSLAYVFQNPYASLNPRRTIGETIIRPLRVLSDTTKAQAAETARAALERVALRADLADRYPDQLSGGERQRVAIARALVTRPDLLICDEVTSALDVSVQATVVELLAQLREEIGLTLLFVTHDIALVRNIAQQVAVLQDGHIVEHGPTSRLFTAPKHDYTKELLETTPALALA